MAFMHRGTERLLILLATSALGSPGLAQPAGEQEIVVTGTRLDPKQVRQQATEFVRKAGLAPGQLQAARWLRAVCPKVIGLSDAQEARVEARVRAIAAAAGIRTAPPQCENNITIVFTDNAQSVMKELATRKPQSLAGLTPGRREQLRTGSEAVRWWHSSNVHDRDGLAENDISAPWIGGDDGAAVGLPIGDNVTSTQQYNGGSHVRTQTVRGLSSATAVIDISRRGEATLEMLTDYAAMVTLAEIGAGEPPVDSILGLFKSEAPPQSLTDWDLALLRALYRMPLDRGPRIQRGHLINGLVAERSRSSDRRNP